MNPSMYVILVSALFAAGHGQSTGDLLVTGGQGGSVGLPLPLYGPSSTCYAGATNLEARAARREYTGTSTTRWGPRLITYPRVASRNIGSTCNPTTWALTRLLATIDRTVAKGLNYCHHYAPTWTTPNNWKIPCTPDGPERCSCAQAGLDTRPMPWNGLDCSNYVGYLFNFGFGYYPVTAIGAQACKPGRVPGRYLPGAGPASPEAFLPGDLLFITGSSRPADGVSPVRVSHVVMWTGYTVDFTPGAMGPFANATLLAQLSPKQRKGAISYMNRQAEEGKPVYVITDSHYTGPNYRPFAGWYVSSFSHARRVLNPSQALPADAPANVVVYDDAADDCMSYTYISG